MLIKKQILKESQGKYKVNLQSYNVSALKDGIFKSLEITGTDTITNGVYASSVKFKTLCDYADFSTNNSSNKSDYKENIEIANQNASLEESVFNNKHDEIKANFHYNIQIHLPATTDISVYNAIFKSIKENLFK